MLGHKGAGSVDFSSKLSVHETASDDHFVEDVLPYLACCALSNNCFKYSAVRPASLRPETKGEFEQACEVLNSTYAWKPYSHEGKDFEPPYLRADMLKEWSALNLNGSSLVPTEELQFVLRNAQDARNLIHAGKDPYAGMTSFKEEEHTTKEEEHTTKEEEHTTKEEEHTTKEEEATTEHKTVENMMTSATHEEELTKAPASHSHEEGESKSTKKRSRNDKEIDNVIAAVLKGQTKKPLSEKRKDGLKQEFERSRGGETERDRRRRRRRRERRRRRREEDDEEESREEERERKHSGKHHSKSHGKSEEKTSNKATEHNKKSKKD